jgi:hypothetical protein
MLFEGRPIDSIRQSLPKMPSWQALDKLEGSEAYPPRRMETHSPVSSATSGRAHAKASPSSVQSTTRPTTAGPAGRASRPGGTRLAVRATRR